MSEHTHSAELPKGTVDAKELAQTNMKAACDLVLERAFSMMIEEMEAEPSLVIDRALTRVGAYLCLAHGSRHTADTFRELAQNIEAGAFHPLTGEGRPRERHN